MSATASPEFPELPIREGIDVFLKRYRHAPILEGEALRAAMALLARSSGFIGGKEKVDARLARGEPVTTRTPPRLEPYPDPVTAREVEIVRCDGAAALRDLLEVVKTVEAMVNCLGKLHARIGDAIGRADEAMRTLLTAATTPLDSEAEAEQAIRHAAFRHAAEDVARGRFVGPDADEGVGLAMGALDRALVGEAIAS